MQLLLLTWCFRLSTKHRVVGWLVLLFERGTYLNLQNLCSDVCIGDSESSCHLNYELRSIKTNQNDWIPCFSLLASFKLDLNFTSCAFFPYSIVVLQRRQQRRRQTWEQDTWIENMEYFKSILNIAWCKIAFRTWYWKSSNWLKLNIPYKLFLS